MSHQPHDIFDDRKQFQLERMILFSDAVFAIAITLLIIEIKVPDTDMEHIRHVLFEKIGELLGFLLSFVVIGQFWTQHHRLFGVVKSYDNKLLWLNLHLLFWIAVVPFSSAMNTRYGGWNGVWMWYSFNMFMIGISLFFIWRYIGKPEKRLSDLAQDPHRAKVARIRSLSVALIFLSGLLLCIPDWFVTNVMARFIYFLIFPAMLIINKKYKKNG